VVAFFLAGAEREETQARDVSSLGSRDWSQRKQLAISDLAAAEAPAGTTAWWVARNARSSGSEAGRVIEV
jgi:hypothetical protein